MGNRNLTQLYSVLDTYGPDIGASLLKLSRDIQQDSNSLAFPPKIFWEDIWNKHIDVRYVPSDMMNGLLEESNLNREDVETLLHISGWEEDFEISKEAEKIIALREKNTKNHENFFYMLQGSANNLIANFREILSNHNEELKRLESVIGDMEKYIEILSRVRFKKGLPVKENGEV